MPFTPRMLALSSNPSTNTASTCRSGSRRATARLRHRISRASARSASALLTVRPTPMSPAPTPWRSGRRMPQPTRSSSSHARRSPTSPTSCDRASACCTQAWPRCRVATSAGSSGGSPRCVRSTTGVRSSTSRMPSDPPTSSARSRPMTTPTGSREFLDRNGFLHVRGVFSPTTSRRSATRSNACVLMRPPTTAPSWWATQADGSEVCCRLIYLARSSDRIGALADDARLRRLAALGGEGLEPEIDCLDGLSVVIKNPDVTAGLSDLPWHRDCGLGGHPVLCPSVAIGIQLDRASAETGQLHFVAGSHRGSSHPSAAGGRGDPTGHRDRRRARRRDGPLR